MQYFDISNRRYLGCKKKLLPFLDDIINANTKNCSTFLDIFGGTGVVSEYFNSRFKILVNDTLVSNFYSYQCFLSDIEINREKIEDILNYYNRVSPDKENYYSINFKNTYLNEVNLKKVGFIRDHIDLLFDSGKINERERAILITSLLYAIDKIANTVGHYDAFRKNGDLDKCLILSYPNLTDSNSGNKIFNEDANSLSKRVSADICYIDPPYNSRQYCDAYHFLENVAGNLKNEVFGTACKMDRSALKSDYCKANAKEAFRDLINNLNCKYILLSYSNTAKKANARSNAKIDDEDILEILNKKGITKVFTTEFNPFSTGKTHLDDYQERVFFCTVGDFNSTESECDNAFCEKEIVQSPLNYTGGKFRLLDQIKKKFPSDIDVFYDVFCGGFNVGSNMEAKKIVGIDKGKELISLLKFLQKQDYYDLVSQIESCIEFYNLSNSYENGYEFYGCNSANGLGSFNKTGFLRLRDDYNHDKSDLLFLLLIFFSFNNQIRFNRQGDFNLPVGKRDFNKRIRLKLKGFINNIKDGHTTFECMDFRDIDLGSIEQNSFLYFDPPYSLGDASYNESNLWSMQDDCDLMDFLDRCNDHGLRFAMSNVVEHKGQQNIPLINWVIDNQYNMEFIDCSYHNASYHGKHKSMSSVTKEVLILNY